MTRRYIQETYNTTQDLYCNPESGISIILAVFALLVFSVLALVLSSMLSISSLGSLHCVEGQQALQIAEAGRQYAIWYLTNIDPRWITDEETIESALAKGAYTLYAYDDVGLGTKIIISRGYIPSKEDHRAMRVVKMEGTYGTVEKAHPIYDYAIYTDSRLIYHGIPGVVQGATQTILTKDSSTPDWVEDLHIGGTLHITSGAAVDNTYTITDNDSTTLTCGGANMSGDGVSAGDHFEISRMQKTLLIFDQNGYILSTGRDRDGDADVHSNNDITFRNGSGEVVDGDVYSAGEVTVENWTGGDPWRANMEEGVEPISPPYLEKEARDWYKERAIAEGTYYPADETFTGTVALGSKNNPAVIYVEGEVTIGHVTYHDSDNPSKAGVGAIVSGGTGGVVLNVMATTLTKDGSTPDWSDDAHIGKTLHIDSGTAEDNTYDITDNDTTTLTCSGADMSGDGVSAGDEFVIRGDITITGSIEPAFGSRTTLALISFFDTIYNEDVQIVEPPYKEGAKVLDLKDDSDTSKLVFDSENITISFDHGYRGYGFLRIMDFDGNYDSGQITMDPGVSRSHYLQIHTSTIGSPAGTADWYYFRIGITKKANDDPETDSLHKAYGYFVIVSPSPSTHIKTYTNGTFTEETSGFDDEGTVYLEIYAPSGAIQSIVVSDYELDSYDRTSTKVDLPPNGVYQRCSFTLPDFTEDWWYNLVVVTDDGQFHKQVYINKSAGVVPIYACIHSNDYFRCEESANLDIIGNLTARHGLSFVHIVNSVTAEILTKDDSTRDWEEGAHIGKTLYILSGGAEGNTYTITDNDSTTLTCSGADMYNDGVRGDDTFRIGPRSEIEVIYDTSPFRKNIKDENALPGAVQFTYTWSEVAD